MSAAITHAATLEYTMAGLNGNEFKAMDFHTFFELCSSTAKNIDKINQVAATKKRELHKAQQGRGGNAYAGRGAGGRGRGRGRGNTPAPGRGNGTSASTATTTTTPGRFEWAIPDDKWKTMTGKEKAAHVAKVNEAKASIAAARARSVNAAATHPTPAPAAAPPAAVAAATVAEPGMREMLSYKTNATRTAEATDIEVNGRKYALLNSHQHSVSDSKL
jgi:hypothetical protein